MFNKVLIANRGEIACRIIETCRKMGIATVAVHSDVDAGARHVDMADEAVSLGGAAPADSYLRADAIIDAALATGAQAIHPGYGFLSENPEFVEHVDAAGLVFVGPSAGAIRAMGLKDAAKDVMIKAGVPVVPGYQGGRQDPGFLSEQAANIGYPVLIKAVAGGGGKGMRRVDRAQDFAVALEAAVREARAAFGNGHVLIEKYVATPRHIEVQVFGDGSQAVHLFERDCSLQRRHQKVIEEAPAPGMSEALRAHMGAAAVRAAQAIGYAGAGTVEFIVDASDGLRADRFYFMEMNTRLQVEHPVTEAITGIDLVEWQLRVAAGEALPMAQGEIPMRGHAIEARLYAEDVQAGFLPATGTLRVLSFPDLCRADTGVRAGDTITPWYDPMIAKITVHGPTRAAALQRMHTALAKCQVAGTVTNLGFLRRLVAHPDFGAGCIDTGLIDRHVEALAQEPAPCTRTRALAAVADYPVDSPAPVWTPLRRIASTDPRVWVVARGQGGWDVDVDGTPHRVTWRGAWSVDGMRVSAHVVEDGDSVHVFWGNSYSFKRRDPLAVEASVPAASGTISAPMPGVVKAQHVQPGDRVAQGDALAVLEAMKMEHVLRAPRAGRVDRVLAQMGDQVVAGAALVVLEDDDEG